MTTTLPRPAEPQGRPGRLGLGWGTAGLVTGVAGLATSLVVAAALGIRLNPVVAVAEAIIRLTPGGVAERAIDAVGRADKPLLVTGILLALALLFWVAGRTSARHPGRALAVFVALAGVGGAAVLTRPASVPTDVIPVVVGGVVWLVVLSWLTTPLREPEPSRRALLLRSGLVLAASAGLVGLSRVVGRGRREVESARRLLRLPITRPPVPAGADLGVSGVEPWQTPTGTFYRIDTAVVVPAILPAAWSLRIHGLVDREIRLDYQGLIERRLTESWLTLNCVSNEVGGDLIGNAWWSGVRLADLLEEAGVQAGADAVKQTSHDGWTCGTPLTALTGDSGALLAVAMNGEPLPLEHGFPVRTLVPGLYGYVSACKWVVDLEVTRFADFTAYWTRYGWSERGPVKLASRVDVPRNGDTVRAGRVRAGGAAWQQTTGVEAVEVSVDGGAWTRADELGRVPDLDTWAQWATTLDVEAGDHELRVRAVSKAGEVQTGARADVVPDGSTGWHTITFTAE